MSDLDKRLAELQARSAARAKARESEQASREKSERIADLERLDRLETAVDASSL